MTFAEIYNRIINLWGDKIDFSDGVFLTPDNETPGTTPIEGPSFYSDTFSKQWDKVEEIVGTDDKYGDLMVWTLYQVFHKHSRDLFQKNIYSITPSDIDKREIEEQFFSNLNEESWEKELAEYKRVIS